jgi:hypothetical protein
MMMPEPNHHSFGWSVSNGLVPGLAAALVGNAERCW